MFEPAIPVSVVERPPISTRCSCSPTTASAASIRRPHDATGAPPARRAHPDVAGHRRVPEGRAGGGPGRGGVARPGRHRAHRALQLGSRSGPPSWPPRTPRSASSSGASSDRSRRSSTCAPTCSCGPRSRAPVYAAAVALDGPERRRSRPGRSVAKTMAGGAAIANGKSGIQVHGGIGFTWEVDAALLEARVCARHALRQQRRARRSRRRHL